MSFLKKHKGKIIFSVIAIVLLALAVWCGRAVKTQDTADKKLTCTLSINCATILDNMSQLKKGKEILVPPDGMILTPQTVTFYEGESVYDVLLRETKRRGIHMEHTDTPAFNSAYIKAINNIYEFDCGNLSGWRYKVNGNIINHGCSRYELHDGDVVEWVYTCDLGEDIKQ